MPNFSNLPDYQTLMEYFNIGIIAIIGLGALGGFFSGFFKSSYRLIVFVAMLLIGWFISPIFVRMMLTYDVSQYYQQSIEGIPITSLKETLPAIIASTNPELSGVLVEGSLTYELIYAIVFMALRLVFVIVWLILMATIFKFFLWIFYLIIKPRSRDANGVRKKKTLGSRTLGLVVGALHAAILIFLFSIPLSGLASLGTALKTVADGLPNDSTEFTLVLTNNSATLVDKRNLDNNDDPFTQYADIFKFMEEYRSTFAGRVGGTIKIGESGLDEFVFDELFSFKVNDNQVKIRYELAVGLRIYKNITDNIEGDFTLENILNIDREVLEEVFEDIGKLKIINVAIPMGIEIATKSDLVELPTDINQLVDVDELIEKILEIDYANEISLIGNSILDLNSLGVFGQDEMTFEVIMSFDSEVVKSLLNNIGSLELVNLAADVGVALLLADESIVATLADIGLTPDDLDFSDINWGDEIKNLGEVFEAFQALGITSFALEDIDFASITDEKINALSLAIFNSKILSNNSRALVQVAINSLPEEQREFFTVMDVNAADLTAILVLGKLIGEMGLLNDEELDPSKITDEYIESIAEYISNSSLLSGNINGLILMLLSSLELPEGLVIEIPEGFDWTGDPGKAEVIALFKSARELIDIMNNEDFLSTLTEEKINTIADTISQSRIMMYNVGNILDYVFSSDMIPEGLNITVDDIDWETTEGQDEFKAILRVVAKLYELGIDDQENFLNNLTPEAIDDLADLITDSTVFMSNVGNILDYFLSNEELTGGLEITIGDIDWTSEDGKNEFKAILNAFAVIIEIDLMNNPDLAALTDDDIEKIAEKLSASSIIRNNLGNIINQMIEQADMEFEIDVFEDPELWTKEEISSLLFAVRILTSKTDLPGDLFNLTEEELNHILRSELITDAIVNLLEDMCAEDGDLYDLLIIDGVTQWKDVYDDDGNRITDGELRKLFNSASILLGENPNFEDTTNLIDPNRILNLSDGTVDTNDDGVVDENDDDEIGELLTSMVLLKSISNQLIKLGQGDDAMLVVNLELNDQRWPSEIRSFIRAAKVVLGEDIDLDNIDIDANILKDLSNERGDEDDDVGEILKSIIITDTIIKQIIDLADGSTLVVNLTQEDPRWVDSDTEDGEIRKIIRAISVIFGEEDDINSPDIDPNVILNLTDDEIGIILASIIASDSIIKVIYDLGQGDDAQIVVNLTIDDARWYDNGDENGELRNLIKAIKIILGDNPDLNNINIDANVLKDLSNERGEEDDQVGDILKSIIITDTIIKTIIDLGAGEESSLVINLTQEDSRWRDGVDTDGEIRKIIRAISVIFGEGDDLNNPDIDPNVILNLTDDEIGIILDSLIASDSIIKVIYDLGQEEGAQIVVNLTIDDARWYDNGDENGELRNLIKAIKIILGDNPDLNNINIDANVLKDLSNERGAEDDEVGDILKSIIITDTIIKTIIDLDSGDGSNLIVNLDQEDPRWRDGIDTDGEIRKVIRAISVIFGDGDDLNNPDIDPNVILNLTDDEVGIILASVIASDSIIKVIFDLGQGDDAQIVVNLTIDDARWYDNGDEKGELRNLIKAIKIILGDNPDLNNINIDANVLKDLSNERGAEDDEVGDILKSIIITDTIIKTIIDLDSGDGSNLIVNLDQEDPRWRDGVDADGEIRKVIRAISVIFGDGDDLNNPDIDPNVILNLTDDEIGIILASIIASDSIIKQIYDLGQGDDAVIVIALTIDDARWYDNGEEEGELRRFIRAIKVILGDNPDLNNVNIDANILKTLSLGEDDPNDDDVKVIQESIIAKDTIIKKIIEISIPAEGEEATLIVNLDADDPRWVDSDDGDGEIRRLIKAIQIIFNKPTDDLNNPNLDPNIILELSDGTVDTNLDGFVDELDDDQLGEILRSIIISDSIIKQLRDLGIGEGAVLVVDLAADDAKWHDQGNTKGEIRNFVKAVEIVLAPGVGGKPDLNDPVIKSQADILRLSEDEISILLSSIILSKTIVKEIIANDDLEIPLYLQDLNAPEWYDDGETLGELHKLIKVIGIIMDEGTTNMNTTKILNMSDPEIDIILDSIIAKTTIIKELRGMEALVINEDHPDFNWDDTYVGEIRTDGELRKLLNSASLLIENDEVNIDKILTLSPEEIDVLVLSRIIVDSAVKELKALTAAADGINPAGSLNGVLYLPEDELVNYHGVNGELKHFFIAIQYLKAANTTPEQGIGDITTISLASLTGDNQATVLASMIVKNTIIVNIENEASRAGSPLKLPAKYVKTDPLYDPSAWDSELPRFLDSIQVFVGTDASLDTMNLSVDDFLNLTDGTVDINGNGEIDKEEDEIKTISSSDIIAFTIVSEIKAEALREGSMVQIPGDINDEDWYGDDGELRKFLMAVSSLTTSGLQVEDTKFLNLSNDEISRIVASRILSYSIVKRIEDERNNPASLISLPDKFNPDHISYDEELWYNDNGELAKTLKALRGLGMTTFDADFSIRPLFDEANGITDEVILASEVVEKTIINKIQTESAAGGSLDGTLIIPANVVWEKTVVGGVTTNEGELRRFLKAIDIILAGGELESATFNVEKFFNPLDQDILLSSLIIEASVINKIDQEASIGGNLYGTLVYPSDWDDSEWYGATGELRRFLTAIEIIIDGGSFETTNFEADKFLGNDRATLLASRIVEASVVEYIIDSANPVDGVLKDSLYLPSGYETNNPNWYGDNGELIKFLDSIKLIVGPAGSYENANFTVDTILGPDRTTLLASRVVEASVVEYVIDSSKPGGALSSTLVIPLDLQTNNDKWYGDNGELNKFLDAISIIIGDGGTYASANFTVDTILGDDQDTLLESRVVEASVIYYIETSSIGLIFPINTNPSYYYFEDEAIVWERTFDNDNFVTDIGELRRFLAGVSAIIGNTGSFATMVFDMNLMLDTDFSIVLQSRVLEATVSDMVDDIIANALAGFIATPADGYQWYYHASSTDVTSGEVRRGEFVLTPTTTQYSDLLGFLISIQEMNTAGLDFNNITLAGIVGCESEDLATALWDYSRVMRGSIATMLNKALEPFSGGFFPVPEFTDAQFTSKQDVIDGLNDIKVYWALINP